jgi:hypothetical protein
MADPAANYVFLPWVRQGAASGIQTIDRTPNQPAAVSVSVKLRVNNTAPDIEREIRLFGPGDVIGLDPQQVVRTEPRHLSTDFEPNYFPAIEFDRPDFPWLFTPAKADAAGQLRPWLCLIVVRKQDGVSIRIDPNLPLPILEIRRPAHPELELPDLSESWAWAHTQVAGTQPQLPALKSSLGGDPALTVSRLLCPRRLDPLTDYIACVVPAFLQGLRAGLGQPVQLPNEQLGLAPAWIVNTTPPPEEVILPIYYRWEFRTGTGGDFESLVAALKARKMPETVGKRPIDLSEPGFKIEPPPVAGAEGTVLGLEGALRVVGSQPDAWSNTTRAPFRTALQNVLNKAWEVANEANDNHDPIVGPPVYGCWHAARHKVNDTAPQTWLDELNLDPRNRVAAAFGTQVVQMDQEDLMTSAWEQLGEIERVNQIRRQGQLGRAVNAVYHTKHFSRFSDEELLKILGPAQSRLVVEPTTTGDTRALLSQKISRSPIPDRAVSAPLRRLTNPRGVVSTRFAVTTTAATTSAPPITFLARMNTANTTALLTIRTTAININQISQAQTGAASGLKPSVASERIIESLNAPPAPTLKDFTVVPEASPRRNLLNFNLGADSRDADMFRKIAKAHHEQLAKLFAPPPTPTVSPINMFATGVKANLLRSVDPERTISARVHASLTPSAQTETAGDPLEPIMDAPSFPQPMYEALRDLSQDYLLPGLEDVPADTVALLETNSGFVESFMVGLNTEMASELLWRNYPTDQRGTYFRQFWDTSAGTAKEDLEKPITQWGNTHLGDNTPNTSGKLVLLIRGELLRRYPNSVIYAVKAVDFRGTLDVSRKATDEKHPLFRGTMKPDVTFVGFDLSDDEALGKPPHDPKGWFFVIQQQPTEPRFGLDVANFSTPQAPPLATWSDLSWRHFANNEEELNALSHVSATKTFPEIDRVNWGRNSAHQAFITLQRPVRVAIHAKQMIRQDES